jgi:hypothetical protein
LFRYSYLFSFTTAKIVKKKFIQRHCVRKVPRSLLARLSRAMATTPPSSGGSSLSASSSPMLSALGARDAPVVEEAPPTGTSKPVPSLREEEDPTTTPAVNPVSAPPVDADLMGVDLIVLSSGSENEVDWEALIAEDEVDWEILTAEDDDIESVGSWSPSRIQWWLGHTAISPRLDVGVKEIEEWTAQ